MRPATRPRILCVDDEPAVLEGLDLHLRRAFDCAMATSGAEGLAVLQRAGPFAAIVSDMRMPGMDGAAFLARAREVAPDAVRILLTGYADVEAAMAAVNQGQVFRFLSKPCSPDLVRGTLLQAVEQHRLQVAERELLEQTLTGAVRALTDLLALAHPVAFGRGARIRRTVAALCGALGMRDRWAVEVAAELSQVGQVALAPGVAEKADEGVPLTPAEQAQVDRASRLADQLLAHIPRLEPVREILAAAAQGAPPAAGPERPEGTALGACVLALALELDVLETGGLRPVEAVAALEARPGHPSWLIDALRRVVAALTASAVREVPLAELRAGMVLAEDVRNRAEVLLVARGYTVSSGLIARLQNIAPSVLEPIRIVVPAGREP